MISYSPKNLTELKDSLNQISKESKIIAGGTDLIIRLRNSTSEPDALVYVGAINEMKDIKLSSGFLEIGASATYSEIITSKLIDERFNAIIDASKDVGSKQIRNNGTLGGNIVNASPGGDLIPVMILLDTLVVIFDKEGNTRELPLKEFIITIGKTQLKYDEVVLKFKVPIPDNSNFRSHFIKLGSREKVTISRVGLSMSYVMEGEKIGNPSFYISSISEKPIRVREVEELLGGSFITEDVEEEVFSILKNLIFKVTPEKFDRNYKMFAIRGVINDLFDKVTY